jgi:hypothetical protein
VIDVKGSIAGWLLSRMPGPCRFQPQEREIGTGQTPRHDWPYPPNVSTYANHTVLASRPPAWRY